MDEDDIFASDINKVFQKAMSLKYTFYSEER